MHRQFFEILLDVLHTLKKLAMKLASRGRLEPFLRWHFLELKRAIKKRNREAEAT